MSKILKKFSAAVLLILMLFSVSFNTISYAASMIQNDDGTVTITSTSGKFKLILLKEMIDETNGGQYLTASNWALLLSKYDGYYDQLTTISGYNPIANCSNANCITIDLTAEELTGGAASDAVAQVNRDKLIIKVEKKYVQYICQSNNSVEFGPLVHELCHLFQDYSNRQDWFFDDNREITHLLLQAIICDQKSVMSSNGSQYENINYFNHRSQSAASDLYKTANEIAYKILLNANIENVKSAITTNNGRTLNTNLERFEKFIKTLNSITGEDLSVLRLSTDNNRTIYQYMGGATESVNGETEKPVTGSITINLNPSSAFQIGKDTKIDVSGTVTVSNATVEKVYINYNDERLDATVTGGNNGIYTYTYTLIPANTTTSGIKTFQAVAQLSNKDLITSEKKSITFVAQEEANVKIQNISIQGNNSKTEGTVDFDKDTQMTIRITAQSSNNVDINKDKLKLNLSIANSNVELKNGEGTGKTITYTVVINLNDDTKNKLKSNNKITVTGSYNSKNITSASQTFTISAKNAIVIKSVQFAQEGSTLGTYNVKGNQAAKIVVNLQGLTNASDITHSTVNLEGFITDGKPVVNISQSGNIATLTQNIKTKDNASFTNKTMQGWVSLVVNGEQLVSYFDVTIENENTDIKITEIEFRQDNTNLKNGILDSKGDKTAKIAITLEGLENQKDITKSEIKIPGFKINQTPTVNINQTSKIATLTYDAEAEEGITNGKVTGTIKINVKGNTLTKTINVEIINAEDTNNEELKFYYATGYGQTATEFKKGDTINISGENSAQFFLIITHVQGKKTLTFERTNYSSEGIYDETKQKIQYGMTFKNSTSNLVAKLDGEEIATINVDITINNQVEYVSLYKNGSGGTQYAEGTVVHTDRNKPNGDDKTGGTDDWIMKEDGSGNLYFCYDHITNSEILFSETTYFYEYKTSEKVSVSPIDQLILAFIKEVDDAEVANMAKPAALPTNWREHALQYYIWKKVANQSCDYGTAIGNIISKLEKLTNNKNAYINVEKMTITIQEGKKTLHIKDFVAIKWIVDAKKYTSNGNLVWDADNTTEDDKMQPLLTFEYKKEEGEGDIPGIQLKKVDENGNPLVASFKVYVKGDDEKWYKIADTNEFTTDSKTGLTDKINVKPNKEYFIIESEAPAGYSPTTQYVIVTTDENCVATYQVYQGTQFDVRGYVNATSSADKGIESDTDSDWTNEEVKVGGAIQLLLKLTDKKSTIRIRKVDEITSEGKPGAVFTAYKVDGKTLKTTGVTTKPTDASGYTDISELFNNPDCYTIVDGKKQIILRETTAPEGYTKSEGVYIIQMNSDGTLSGYYYETLKDWQNSTNKKDLTAEDGGITIQIKNKMGKPTLELLKVDKEGKPITAKNGKFQVTIDANGTIVYNETIDLVDGKIKIELTDEQIAKITSTSENRIKLTITVKELKAPTGYSVGKDDTFTFVTYYYAETGWENPTQVEGHGVFTVTKTGGTISMQLVNEEDIPRIEINKVNEADEPISGTAIFKVYAEDGTVLGTISVTNGVSETFKIPSAQSNKTYTFNIVETDPPTGYEPDGSTYKLVIQLDVDGKISNALVNNKPADINGNLVSFKVVNKPVKPDKLKLKILKLDASNNNPMKNVEFEISGSVQNGATITDENGIIKRDFVKVELGAHYEVTMQEKTPTGYIKNDNPITISFEIDENGVMQNLRISSTNNQGVSVKTEQETEPDGTKIIVIKVTVLNYPESSPELEVPLLMYIEGNVWLDEISGKNSTNDGKMNSGNDKMLEGVIVELFEEDGKTPALIADAADVQKALNKITTYQTSHASTSPKVSNDINPDWFKEIQDLALKTQIYNDCEKLVPILQKIYALDASLSGYRHYEGNPFRSGGYNGTMFNYIKAAMNGATQEQLDRIGTYNPKPAATGQIGGGRSCNGTL